MNKELSLRTLAYLVGYYKTHNETIINLEEIESINFILDENEQLQQENKQLKEKIDNVAVDLDGTLFVNEHHIEETKGFKFEYVKMDVDHIKDLLDILKGDSNE